MIMRSSLVVGVVVSAIASFGLAGCERGGNSVPSTSAVASTSQAPATLDAAGVKTASCAAFNKAVVKAQKADDAFGHALEDPKRPKDQWNKPMSDAADNAAVILSYVAKDVESNAIKPQLDPALVDQFKQFVQLTRDRAPLYTFHKGTDELNANSVQWDAAMNKLIDTCK